MVDGKQILIKGRVTMANVLYPPYFNPSQVGQVYQPNVGAAIAAGRRVGWGPAALDGRKGNMDRVCLVVVDAQIDFVHPDGALPVTGASGDMQRLIDLIYHEGHRITTVVPTIDTHTPFMIFFAPWWINARGENPDPYTIITVDDIKNGVWRAVVDTAWSHAYVEKLAQGGKYSLMIWPFHCMDTSPGFALVPPLYEAMMFHAGARFAQPVFVHKGQIPQTEFYSPLRPEVDVPQVPGGTINMPILSLFAKHGQVWVTGEAMSHCVLSFMETFCEYFAANAPEVLRSTSFLMDCTSAVVHPAVDFKGIATKRLQEMATKHGVVLCNSTDLYR